MKNLLVLLIILLSTLQGCMYYYKVQTVKPIAANQIKQYDSLKKYLILHQRDTAWHLTIRNINENELSGNVSVLPNTRMKYKTTKPNRGNRYERILVNEPNEKYVLEEVHLYLQDSLLTTLRAGDMVKLAYPVIKKAEVYKKAIGRTLSSWLIPAFVLPGLAIGIIAIIVGNMAIGI